MSHENEMQPPQYVYIKRMIEEEPLHSLLPPPMDESAAQFLISLSFISFAAAFSLFSLLLLLLRSRPWCGCDICTSYLNATWTADFDNISDWYTHLLRRSPTGTIHIHVLRNTVTSNPANVEHILKTNFANFPKGRAFSAILGDLLGGGIFNADGAAWRFQRKVASLELGSVCVRSFASSIVASEISLRLIPSLASSPAADLQEVFRRFAFAVICRISFGLDPDELSEKEFESAFDRASALSAGRAAASSSAVWKLKRALNLGSERELRESIRVVRGLAEEVIRRRRKLPGGSKHDLLSRFMGSVEDDVYLRDIVISFLLAGRDTVASGLTAFFMLVSENPRVAAAIREEAGGILAGYEELSGLQYAQAAVHESLRLFPPVQFDSKYCDEDDVLADGTFVRMGTRVTYHPYAMGRMESIWGADAAEFRPERWLRDGVFLPESPYRYPVFQGGPRTCLGKEMAVMEMKAVAVAVLREFDVEPVRSGPVRPKFAPGLTASLDGGFKVRLRRRKGNDGMGN